MAESLGGERLGARKEARSGGWGGPESRGLAGERGPARKEAAAAAVGEAEASGVRPLPGSSSSPGFPHPLRLLEPRAGRGAGETWSAAPGPGSRPESGRRAARSARCSRQLGGGAAGVGAGGRVHAGGRRGAESGRCPRPAAARVARRGAGPACPPRGSPRSALQPPAASGPRVGAPLHLRAAGVCPILPPGEKCRSGSKIPREHCSSWRNIVRS